MPFCQKCGNQMNEGERFCANCGHDSYSRAIGASGAYKIPVSQPQYYPQPAYPPQYYPQPIQTVSMQTSGSRKAYWLGIIGGIIGIMVAIGIAFLGSFAESLTGQSNGLTTLALLEVAFSIMGMAGSFLEGHKLVGGILMLGGAIGIFLFAGWFGVLSAILFVIGGLLMISDSMKETKAAVPVYGPAYVQTSYPPQAYKAPAPNNQQPPAQPPTQTQK